MVAKLAGLLLYLAAPFWEAKPPAEWTAGEARGLLRESPWAQLSEVGRNGAEIPVPVYIATAEPVMHAEDRVRAASKSKGEDPGWTDYRDYLAENAGKCIVLAILVTKKNALLDNVETTRMENESYLFIGRRKYGVKGHFPPSSSDPFVRLVFPREVRDGDKSLRFELYVPGTGAPFRNAEFPLKEMRYQGRPSY
ncbi:MAG: hypothetical protein JSU00_21995 [Acidobacteria bacterium]|nr:hypothetical protein [Acidobacteriota bacterium]